MNCVSCDICVYHLWFVCVFPWGIPQLQSDWSLFCDHGLDYATTTTADFRLPTADPYVQQYLVQYYVSVRTGQVAEPDSRTADQPICRSAANRKITAVTRTAIKSGRSRGTMILSLVNQDKSPKNKPLKNTAGWTASQLFHYSTATTL